MYEILGVSFELLGPALTLEYSDDPAEIDQAWIDLKRLAQEGAALSRQAVGQTTDPNLKAAAQTLANQFDQIAAAAAARDKEALDAIGEPDEPAGGVPAVCGL